MHRGRRRGRRQQRRGRRRGRRQQPRPPATSAPLAMPPTSGRPQQSRASARASQIGGNEKVGDHDATTHRRRGRTSVSLDRDRLRHAGKTPERWNARTETDRAGATQTLTPRKAASTPWPAITPCAPQPSDITRGRRRGMDEGRARSPQGCRRRRTQARSGVVPPRVAGAASTAPLSSDGGRRRQRANLRPGGHVLMVTRRQARRGTSAEPNRANRGSRLAFTRDRARNLGRTYGRVVTSYSANCRPSPAPSAPARPRS